MSANLAKDFFPWVYGEARKHAWTRWTWDQIFPTSVERLCPTPELSLNKVFGEREAAIVVRWPYASIFCGLGMAIGFGYAVGLLREAFSSTTRKKGAFTWGMAFAWYGMMSAGALMHHCLKPHFVFYLMDVVSTACCSLSIATACLLFIMSPDAGSFFDDRGRPWRCALAASFPLIVGVAGQGPQALRDALYVVPALLALACGTCVVALAARARAGLPWICFAAAFEATALVALPLDPWLCFHFGPNFTLLFWFFLGSDGAIACLYNYVRINTS